MSPAPRILLLEDSQLDAELLLVQLETLDPRPEMMQVATRAEYKAALDAGGFDVILSDFSLPDFDGMQALEMASAQCPDIPFIFVSGVLGEEVAIESFRRGATDYVLKQRLIRLPAAIERALAEARERSERQRAERQKELLVRELSHRVKNTMAMVMSLVRRTATSSQTVDAYSESLLRRLGAMADLHALLFERNWSDTELEDILRRTIEPYGRGNNRFEIEGASGATLDPKGALALSMVFNELVTNAVKYGALASDNGKVKVTWSITDGPSQQVDLTWREIDGPAVKLPESQGFGTTLIQRSIEYELQGIVEIDYTKTGLVCRMSFPLDP